MWIDSFVPTELTCGSCLNLEERLFPKVTGNHFAFCQCANTGGERFAKEICSINPKMQLEITQ